MRDPKRFIWHYLHQRRGLVVVEFVPVFKYVEVGTASPSM